MGTRLWSFYKFSDFPDHAELRKPLKALCEELSDVRLHELRQIESPVSPEEEALHHGHSSGSPLAAGEDAPFRWDHVRVKLKKEVVIDVRNDYETRIGKFKGAVDPCTAAFQEFPFWVENEFHPPEVDAKHSKEQDNDIDTNIDDVNKVAKQGMPRRIAMYCTGGIRCEKALSYLLSKGFKEVYHLRGGILKYLGEVPRAESLWEGECLVFDKRVSVEHVLAQGSFKLCYGCKQPVSDVNMEAPEWEYGVSFPYCYSSESEEEKERARARPRQFEAWGIIGGPDKGRCPTLKVAQNKSSSGTVQ